MYQGDELGRLCRECDSWIFPAQGDICGYCGQNNYRPQDMIMHHTPPETKLGSICKQCGGIMEDKWNGSCAFCGHETDSAFAESEILRLGFQPKKPKYEVTKVTYANRPKDSFCICDNCSQHMGGVRSFELHQIKANLVYVGVVECDICSEVGAFLYYTVIEFETPTLLSHLV